MFRIRTRTLALVALGALVLPLAACGGDDAASPSDGSTSSQSDSTDASDSPDATTDDSSDDTDAAPTGDPDEGGCHVDVTGDVATTFDAGGGIMAVNTDYWLTPAQKEMFGDGFYFILNCQGAGGSYLGILAGANASTETITYGPATYPLSPTDALFGGAGEDSTVQVMFTLDDDEGVWGVSEPGQVEITAFDDDHIAGTVQFTATDVLADMAGTPERSVTVDATFDFANPN